MLISLYAVAQNISPCSVLDRGWIKANFPVGIVKKHSHKPLCFTDQENKIRKVHIFLKMSQHVYSFRLGRMVGLHIYLKWTTEKHKPLTTVWEKYKYNYQQEEFYLIFFFKILFLERIHHY